MECSDSRRRMTKSKNALRLLSLMLGLTFKIKARHSSRAMPGPYLDLILSCIKGFSAFWACIVLELRKYNSIFHKGLVKVIILLIVLLIILFHKKPYTLLLHIHAKQPGLDCSEACHRLAPIEGRKENKQTMVFE